MIIYDQVQEIITNVDDKQVNVVDAAWNIIEPVEISPDQARAALSAYQKKKGVVMSKFEREDRYIVIKRSDLTQDDMAVLSDVIHDRTIKTRDCVVVESHWPNYDQTWQTIQQVAEGTYKPAAPDVSALVEALEWYAEHAAGCRKISSEGDKYRGALDRDGGSIAETALSAYLECKENSNE